jgi:hypothetical protein
MADKDKYLIVKIERNIAKILYIHLHRGTDRPVYIGPGVVSPDRPIGEDIPCYKFLIF